ncbi:hypothetical protein [Actinomadura rudentiformis]|uniref:Uncharacterized protein n=1 Tax=Actinomadura rudentiformis TaxID=359158 RepID=A0A6H9YD25_9ACTN|nr:hypothetical protein [Actinomadura rudentiformis]KAB2342068.1 hypothetical protein F8566_38985 [Actinomadura rudentiformis]
MIDDIDEPLEGDIGPSVRPSSQPASAPASSSDKPPVADAAAELRRYEEEREARRRRINAASARVAAVLAALLLAFLVYDSAVTALEARRRNDPWIYPPATVGALCVIALAGLLVWSFHRRRR